MKRETRDPVKTKQLIISKSAPIFNRYGYAGTSMAMILKATGFQKGGIYNHFKSKNDLAKAAFLYNANQLKEVYLKDVNKHDNPKAQLEKFLSNYSNFLRKPTMKSGCPLLNTITEVDDTDEDFRKLVKTSFDSLVNEIAQIIIKGQEQNIFNKNLDPIKEIEYIFAMVEGSIFLGILKRRHAVIIDIYNRVMDYVKDRIYKV